MKQILATSLIALVFTLGLGAQSEADLTVSSSNIVRAITLADATWEKSIKGTESNLYMADVYDTTTGWCSGASDVWPYTAAIEAHCSILEALNYAQEIEELKYLYEAYYTTYLHRLDVLIDNLEYYKGTYKLSSYATTNKTWSPYAVPRSGSRGTANVTGILNVYDDQMWIARELIRAYRITGNPQYLDRATYLADYCIEGWDCWRDDNGDEYGGITWGPGYNSKHACSNGPLIQPLVWLYEIYSEADAELELESDHTSVSSLTSNEDFENQYPSGVETEYYYRNASNSVVHEKVKRSEFYLDFAKKIYQWPRNKLYDDKTSVFFDMMGADFQVIVKRGYRQHVDNGDKTGEFYSYNTGTMIAGAAELYKVTGEKRYQEELNTMTAGAHAYFAKYIRKYRSYEYSTDETAENGFKTWFNNVLMRSYYDATPYCTNEGANKGLSSFQTALDYAFENHNRNDMLPIHLYDGWGSETKTKGFFQFTFASEFALLAKKELKETAGIAVVYADSPDGEQYQNSMVFRLDGTLLGVFENVKETIPTGIYLVGGVKMMIRH